ncbi:MAG TPA: bifunctional phosphopantothenoylcysteine decarboxylase/phosphopantothenate--cysteine ligase CoaBC [Aquifex aeolicus]|nr:bifunctional phosphopantothenoylcysteine decarboxylase/phosphopantothenate--cysteine ligase CoaBC [Aquificales bacterium]HIQ26074.1 bifunctional phosphopantothenoylcysteine decarboxylase/phosphopantothenate--cysteine ligase CoaBC [Aquifex aeolicus]
MFLKGKRILIGITGGIASYKVYELIRLLIKEGAEVKTVLTPSALNFVSPTVLSTLSGKESYWDWNYRRPLIHIDLAKWCDAFLIAPATVNTISKLACGIADNLLTATWFACHKPKLIAPAANSVMLSDSIICENLKRLKKAGVEIIPSDEGLLACGDVGEGKLANVNLIRDYLVKALTPQRWKGKTVLITLGSTKEYLDPVRFISNSSSGKMGLALAKAIFYQGGEPILVAGDIKVDIPHWFRKFTVDTSEELLKLCLELFPSVDAVFMNAAVTDYRFKETFRGKLKKKEQTLKVELDPTPDILKELGKRKDNQLLVGFAVETENLIENALQKLKRKNLDAIVVNPAEVMGKDRYEGILLTKDGRKEEIKTSTKEEGAFLITKKVAQIFMEDPQWERKYR